MNHLVTATPHDGANVVMPTPAENVCCNSRPCITTDIFDNIVLNRDILAVVIGHWADVYSNMVRY